MLYTVVGVDHERHRAHEPEQAEKGAGLEELLVAQVVARIDFEDENMVDS